MLLSLHSFCLPVSIFFHSQKRNHCIFCYVSSFLKAHKCKANISRQRIETGFARWAVVFIKCRNIDTVIPAVLCEKSCINPATCKRLPRWIYRPISIMPEIPVTDRNGTTTHLSVPTSCQCIAKTRKCSKSWKNRRKLSSRKKLLQNTCKCPINHDCYATT